MSNLHHTYVSLTDKIKMVQLRESGASFAELARKFQRDEKTVKLWIERWQNEETLNVRPKSGAMRCLSAQHEVDLISHASSNRYMTGPMLRSHFRLDCTNRTVQHYLNRNEVRTFKEKVKPAIVPVNREGRVRWAEILKDWSLEDWKRVIFTDESSFYNQRTCSRRVWRYRGTESSDTTIPDNYRRFRINVWAAISSENVEFVARVSENFNAREYLRVLAKVIPQLKNKLPNLIWMHDNVAFHRTNAVEEFFELNNVQKMKWPPQSADMNPIENLWALISQKLDKLVDEKGNAKTPNELFERVLECAADITPETLGNLYASLPNRWRLVIEKDGGPTRY